MLGYAGSRVSASRRASQSRSLPRSAAFWRACSGARSAAAATVAETVEMLPGGRRRSSRSMVGRCATAYPTRIPARANTVRTTMSPGYRSMSEIEVSGENSAYASSTTTMGAWLPRAAAVSRTCSMTAIGSGAPVGLLGAHSQTTFAPGSRGSIRSRSRPNPWSAGRRRTASRVAPRWVDSTPYMEYVGMGTMARPPDGRKVLAMMSSTSSAPAPTRICDGSTPTYAAAASASAMYMLSGYSLRGGSNGPASAAARSGDGRGEVFRSKRRMSDGWRPYRAASTWLDGSQV